MNDSISNLKTPTTSIRIDSNASPLSNLRNSLARMSQPRMTQPRTSEESALQFGRSSDRSLSESSTQPAQPAQPNMYTTIQGFLPGWLGTVLGYVVSVKFLLIVGVCLLIFWQFRPYFSYMNDLVNMVKSLLDTSIDLASATSTNIVDSTAKGSNVVVDKISGKKKQKVAPEPDDSTSTVQGGSKGSYCLAGEWKGVRSCVRVNDEKDCSSGDLYETKDKCVTPELR